MSEEPTQRDLEIRAAIDELSEANETVQRMLDEVRRWEQHNPPPAQPRSVRSMAEAEEFERRNEEARTIRRTNESLRTSPGAAGGSEQQS